MNYPKEIIDNANHTIVRLASDERFPEEEPVYDVHYLEKSQALSMSGGYIKMRMLKDYLKKKLSCKNLSVIFFNSVHTLEGREDLQIFYRYLR